MSKITKGLLSIASILSLAACSNTTGEAEELVQDDNPDKGLETFGETIQYDPNKLVNEGEPISIEYWTWGETDPINKLAESYEEIYPNVDIEVSIQPWDDFWTKLPLSLKGEDGPALFNIHNSQHDNIFPYLAPYDIPVEDLQADFESVDSHVIDGEVYYTDYLINSGNIYYNKTLWEEAGLSEDDIPQTWDEFTEVAKQLTKYDEDGNIIQAGYNFNGDISAIYEGLNYQKEELLFNEDGTANFDNSTTKENFEYLTNLYEKEKVGSKDFGDDSSMSFGNAQTAMVYKWGWFLGELNNNYSDIDFGVFATPTPTEEVPFAYDRYNGESTPGVNKNQSEEQQAVAQDFLKYILAGEEYSVEGALSLASFPSKKSLVDNPDVLENPVLKALSPRVDRLIWPGPFPATVETTATQVMEDILYNGKDIDQALSDGQEQMDKDMENAEFNSLQSSYKFFDELN
ncbi:extracellular solute-binding protein [Lacticigenium naphthae]|uniref:extracellular solute-binding protein n=1 Tax=Lacticigenium naphthae TaxID=515351 RepID=UPI00040D29C0|nr:extracellular solute-binding protein [Lacticigenium naphthae]